MTKLLTMLLNDKRGATAIEYGLILAFVFLAIATALSGFAETNVDMWNLVAMKMASN